MPVSLKMEHLRHTAVTQHFLVGTAVAKEMSGWYGRFLTFYFNI